MFNFTETPDEYFERVKEILNWGARCYPMRFQPINTLKKDAFVSEHWTSEQCNMVAQARRVIGYGGAFSPFKGLAKKLNTAANFNEAFKLYPRKNDRVEKEPALKLDTYFEE